MAVVIALHHDGRAVKPLTDGIDVGREHGRLELAGQGADFLASFFVQNRQGGIVARWIAFRRISTESITPAALRDFVDFDLRDRWTIMGSDFWNLPVTLLQPGRGDALVQDSRREGLG